MSLSWTAAQRILFSGDEVAPFVMLYWQQEEPQPTIEQYARNLEKLLARRAEFDHVCWGHGEGLLDASLVEDCLENARQIMSGAEGEPMTRLPTGLRTSSCTASSPSELLRYKESHIGYDVRYVFDR